ncbi:MAG: hypothetical protein ACRCX8_20350 [Sarcina sp.]
MFNIKKITEQLEKEVKRLEGAFKTIIIGEKVVAVGFPMNSLENSVAIRKYILEVLNDEG